MDRQLGMTHDMCTEQNIHHTEILSVGTAFQQ